MVYVTGDMHGDESRLYDAQWRKLKAGDILIVCGDFGYLWDGGKREKACWIISAAANSPSALLAALTKTSERSTNAMKPYGRAVTSTVSTEICFT